MRDPDMDRERSAVIGDRETDMQLATNMGLAGLRVGPDGMAWSEVAGRLLDQPRTARVERRTNETAISVSVNLDADKPIGNHTGIGFFDHMLDQLTSHAQLGVTLRCGLVDKASAQPRAEKDCFAPLKDYATGLSSRAHDQDIFVACGTALGLALKRVVDEALAPRRLRVNVQPQLP